MKRIKCDDKPPAHQYEEITKGDFKDANIKETYQSSMEVNMMENIVAYSIQSSAVMTMADCVAYVVPKTHDK